MRVLCLLFLAPLTALVACSDDGASVDTAGEADTDTDTDTDTDADTDTDSDTDADTGVYGSIEGYVLNPDGTGADGTNLQFCDTLCFNGEAEADGYFFQDELEDGSYKVDAIGEIDASNKVSGTGLGHVRVHATIDGANAYTMAESMVLPEVSSWAELSGSSTTFTSPGGDVTLTASASSFTPGFGWDSYGYAAGVVSPVPAYWEGYEAAIAVAFLPFAATVNESFSVSFTAPAGAAPSYDVYSIDDKGKLEGPVGTAALTGPDLVIADIEPSLLSWLVLVE